MPLRIIVTKGLLLLVRVSTRYIAPTNINQIAAECFIPRLKPASNAETHNHPIFLLSRWLIIAYAERKSIPARETSIRVVVATSTTIPAAKNANIDNTATRLVRYRLANPYRANAIARARNKLNTL